MQISASSAASYVPPAADPAVQAAKTAELTQLAVAQTNVKMTAQAGAALAQATGELTGTLVNISV